VALANFLVYLFKGKKQLLLFPPDWRWLGRQGATHKGHVVSDIKFKYSIDRIRSQFSKDELIDSLKQFSRIRNDSPFGMRDYDSWSYRRASSDTIRRYFGTWGKALQSAEIRTGRGHKLDPKEMVIAFKTCWRQCGAVPRVSQLEAFLDKNKCPFRYKSYLNFWGGLGKLASLVVQVERGEVAESKLYERQKTKAVLNRAIPLKLRYAVLKRDEKRCVKCGANPESDKSTKLQVDHITPVSKGGRSEMGNLQTLCFACNQGKKDRDD
jgi:hypothetical protein